jgi:hypothetical protein
MKKVPFNELSTQSLRVRRDDDPLANFPLLRIRGDFSMTYVTSLVSTINAARGCSKEHGNVDALTASMMRGWDPGTWPMPYINIQDRLELIDRRHSKSAAEALLIKKVPAVEYVRAACEEWDHLSLQAILVLAAIRFNVDGTTNATQQHFVHAILTVCQMDNLDNTDIDIVRGLLDLAGVNERYSHKSTVTAIENAILKHDSGQAVSMTNNSTDEEFTIAMDSLAAFGDNQTDKDGTKLYTMVADKRFNKRYAWDLLRHLWEGENTNTPVRILVRSKSTTARGVREDREDLFEKVVEYCNLSYGSYKGFAEKQINSMLAAVAALMGGDDIQLIRKGIENVSGEVFVLHQLDGEEAPIQVDFLDYYPTIDLPD